MFYFAAMSESEKADMFRNRLSKVYKHRSKQARRQSVSCYRLYDHDMTEFPFCIELYDDKVYLAEYLRRHGMEDEEHDLWLNQCLEMISEVTGILTTNTFVRQRKRMSHREGQYEKLDTRQDFLTVFENGHKFQVNLTDYLDTGLFLDHRITRRMVKDLSNNKQVLNLFCYTGSFSVYAAAGGAASVTSVDLSKTYLNWAEDNLAINKYKDKEKYHFHHADVKQYLKTLTPESFDLVIIDPPTFSNSKRMKDFLDIQRDHVELLNDTLAATSKEGLVYFSTNYSKFQMDTEQIKACDIKDITKATTPFDFEGKLKRACFKLVK